jgi:hypothetical protein
VRKKGIKPHSSPDQASRHFIVLCVEVEATASRPGEADDVECPKLLLMEVFTVVGKVMQERYGGDLHNSPANALQNSPENQEDNSGHHYECNHNHERT